MRILHTADWHLGKRVNRIDRTEDLRRAVQAVMALCAERQVDVLVIAGDLFDRVSRPDDVQAAMSLFREAVTPFLQNGGTILVVSGNHDGELVPQTIQHALALGDPTALAPGSVLSRGRLHLFARPSLHRIQDDQGVTLQLVLMPYPFPSRYQDDALENAGGGPEVRNRQLRQAFTATIARLRSHRAFDPRLHSMLVAHLFLTGAVLPGGYAVSLADEGNHIVCPPEELGTGWAYVALGDIHRAQTLGGQAHVRYSGSIDRLAIDEKEDDKGVVLLDIDDNGLVGTPEWITIAATPFLDLTLNASEVDFDALRASHPDSDRALVRCRLLYRPGEDDVDTIHQHILNLFPRCYSFEAVAAERPRAEESRLSLAPGEDVRTTVLRYLKDRLEAENDPDAPAVLELAAQLLGTQEADR